MTRQQRMLVSVAVAALLAVTSCAAPAPQPDAEAKGAVQSLIERAIDRRNHQVVTGFSSTKDEISMDFVPAAIEGIELEYRKLHQRRDAIAPYGVLLTDTGSEITIKKFTITQTGAKVEISEQTQLEHGPVNGVQGPGEGYVYDQTVELERTGDAWKISSIAPENPGKPYPTTVVDPDTI
ncbi:hypothetical protein [Arthrobacter sp. yr096]|uniref:hypothetical protein n=1 Tax=Arthrobacter sp. yr096 TaxID=1761750 RepID=UPI00115FE4A6|nr:hypothetical protein [Arthrobacter sp. yr096]